MSHDNKLSLWQKLKRLLTSPAPQPASIERSQTAERLQTADRASQDTPSIAKANPKVSLVKPRPASPIVDTIKQFLQDKHWHYTYYRPRADDSQQSHHLSLRMRNGQLDCGYLFRIQEKNALLAFYGILPFMIPESHQSAAMLLVTQINYDMIIGNLEMDVRDGEIRYKNAIDVEAIGLDDDIIEQLLQSVVAMTTVSFEIFDDLLNFENPSEDIQTLLLELRQQSDARTFYLPTQFVQ
ncbi:YbjN domain-containing protein [Psychrobacter sp. DM4]|uniref:YbjN domain-containing protein n=1 Tax=Psychrobacter sp. DM4 TaxID=3440637 RepID=UPI003F4F6817